MCLILNSKKEKPFVQEQYSELLVSTKKKPLSLSFLLYFLFLFLAAAPRPGIGSTPQQGPKTL